MEVPWVLLAAALLPSGWATKPLPTLAPPLIVAVAGQPRRLVACVVRELAPGSGHAVWISGGNGSALQPLAYGTSREDGGTVCAVALLPGDPRGKGDLACHVGPNATAPTHSSSPVCFTGEEEVTKPCPSSVVAVPACASVALLAAIRLVLLKVALCDAILTSLLLAQS